MKGTRDITFMRYALYSYNKGRMKWKFVVKCYADNKQSVCLSVCLLVCQFVCPVKIFWNQHIELMSPQKTSCVYLIVMKSFIFSSFLLSIAWCHLPFNMITWIWRRPDIHRLWAGVHWVGYTFYWAQRPPCAWPTEATADRYSCRVTVLEEEIELLHGS